MEHWLTDFVWVVEHTFAGHLVIMLTSLCIGSFLNTVIRRVPVMVQRRQRDMALVQLNVHPPERFTPNLFWPRSRCDICHRQIKVRHLIPVVSYFFLKGRCALCGQPISSRHLWVEIGTACLLLLTLQRFGFNASFLFHGVFLCTLLTLSVIDWEKHLLPDELTIPLLWTGILFVALLPEHGTMTIEQSTLGAVTGYLLLWLINTSFRKLRGREGMGYGDFKLTAAIGAWVGLNDLLMVVVIAAVFGLVFGLTLLGRGKYEKENGVPFGPFLALGAALVVLVEPIEQLI